MELTLEFETKRFRKWTERIIKNMDREGSRKALKAMAFEFLARVIKKTPVDTGRARAGWTSYLLDHGMPGVAGPDPEAVALGVSEGSWQERFKGAEKFIIIINAVEYIVVLEFGHSGQAPAGMMRLTFRELQAGPEFTGPVRDELIKAIRKADRAA